MVMVVVTVTVQVEAKELEVGGLLLKIVVSCQSLGRPMSGWSLGCIFRVWWV